MKPNHQAILLGALTTSKAPVSVYLVNGIRLQGHIDAQDQYTLLLKNEGIAQLVYKHAITTILPADPMPTHLFNTNNEELAEEGNC